VSHVCHSARQRPLTSIANTVAQDNSAIDQGYAAASAAGEQAVVNHAKADAEAQATARDDIDTQLAAIGAQRKE